MSKIYIIIVIGNIVVNGVKCYKESILCFGVLVVREMDLLR